MNITKIALWLLILMISTAPIFAAECPAFQPNGDQEIIIGPSQAAILQTTINEAVPGTIIKLQSGTYTFRDIVIDSPGITLTSESGNREDVIIDGEYSGGSIINIQASDVTIADITLRRAWYHPIHVRGGGDRTHIYNVKIEDGRQQFIKINPSYQLEMNDYGIIECSHLELTNEGRNFIHANPTPGHKCYTGGIDGHKSRGWIIRDNTIENIYCTNGGLAEHAVHFWTTSRDTLVERNHLINNARGIGFGLGATGASRTYDDDPYPDLPYKGHIDGVIRNNIIYVEPRVQPYYDTGIGLEQAAGAKVFHNTLPNKPTFSSIDYRFPNTRALIANNIAYKITQRGSGRAELDNNIIDPDKTLFVNFDEGDFTPAPTALDIINSALKLNAVAGDFNKNARGNQPDIGAIEFQGIPREPTPEPEPMPESHPGQTPQPEVTPNPEPEISEPRTLRVGPTRDLKKPSQAAAIAQDGDTILIDAGFYKNDISIWRANDLTIKGVEGKAHLDASGFKIPNKKAIWVIKGDNTVVEHIEFSGAKVPDRNGAGIRQEGTNLTVRHSYFHHNEEGILTGKNPDSEILVEFSEFSHHGRTNNGYSHNIYIGHVKKFTLRYSYMHHAQFGHNVKSRAKENHIKYNRIMDEHDGYSSYLVDIPNGGKTFLIGNLFHQGEFTENWHAISYAAEGATNPDQELYVTSNTFVNNRPSGRGIRAMGYPEAEIINNIFYNFEEPIVGDFDSDSIRGNIITNENQFQNLQTFDYRLIESSIAINNGIEPTEIDGFSLQPQYEYAHKALKETKHIQEDLDVGAIESQYDHTNEIPDEQRDEPDQEPEPEPRVTPAPRPSETSRPQDEIKIVTSSAQEPEPVPRRRLPPKKSTPVKSDDEPFHKPLSGTKSEIKDTQPVTEQIEPVQHQAKQLEIDLEPKPVSEDSIIEATQPKEPLVEESIEIDSSTMEIITEEIPSAEFELLSVDIAESNDQPIDISASREVREQKVEEHKSMVKNKMGKMFAFALGALSLLVLHLFIYLRRFDQKYEM